MDHTPSLEIREEPAPKPKASDYDLRDAATHEAGHAVALVALGIDRDFVARVSRRANAKGRAGYVRFIPSKTTPAQRKRARSDLARFLRDPEYAEAIADNVMNEAIMLYSGVAAQFAFTRGWNDELAFASGRDRKILADLARRFGREVNHWVALDAAVEFVDEHWGEVVAVAKVLEKRFKLTRAEVVEIMAAAPKERNAWREPLWPSQVARKLAEAAGEIPAAAMVVELQR